MPLLRVFFASPSQVRVVALCQLKRSLRLPRHRRMRQRILTGEPICANASALSATLRSLISRRDAPRNDFNWSDAGTAKLSRQCTGFVTKRADGAHRFDRPVTAHAANVASYSLPALPIHLPLHRQNCVTACVIMLNWNALDIMPPAFLPCLQHQLHFDQPYPYRLARMQEPLNDFSLMGCISLPNGEVMP